MSGSPGGDPVAGDVGDGRVEGRGHSHRGERLRLADRFRHVGMGVRRPGANPPQLGPDALLERRPGEVDLDRVERLEVAAEVGAQAREDAARVALLGKEVGPESGEEMCPGGRRVGIEGQRSEAAVPDDGEEPPDRRPEGPPAAVAPGGW